jgi:hypothetical protein
VYALEGVAVGNVFSDVTAAIASIDTMNANDPDTAMTTAFTSANNARLALGSGGTNVANLYVAYGRLDWKVADVAGVRRDLNALVATRRIAANNGTGTATTGELYNLANAFNTLNNIATRLVADKLITDIAAKLPAAAPTVAPMWSAELWDALADELNEIEGRFVAEVLTTASTNANTINIGPNTNSTNTDFVTAVNGVLGDSAAAATITPTGWAAFRTAMLNADVLRAASVYNQSALSASTASDSNPHMSARGTNAARGLTQLNRLALGLELSVNTVLKDALNAIDVSSNDIENQTLALGNAIITAYNALSAHSATTLSAAGFTETLTANGTNIESGCDGATALDEAIAALEAIDVAGLMRATANQTQKLEVANLLLALQVQLALTV